MASNAFSFDGDVERDMEKENRFRRSRGRCGSAVRNGTCGMTSSPGLWDGLALFIIIMMQATSSEMEDDVIGVSIGCISECDLLSVIRTEEKYAWNASVMSTGNSTRKLLDIMKFGMAQEMDCERVL